MEILCKEVRRSSTLKLSSLFNFLKREEHGVSSEEVVGEHHLQTRQQPMATRNKQFMFQPSHLTELLSGVIQEGTLESTSPQQVFYIVPESNVTSLM